MGADKNVIQERPECRMQIHIAQHGDPYTSNINLHLETEIIEITRHITRGWIVLNMYAHKR